MVGVAVRKGGWPRRSQSVDLETRCRGDGLHRSLPPAASRSENISAAYVSPMQYASVSCNQLREEAARVSSRAIQATGAQDQKRPGTPALTGRRRRGLFWPALFLIKGDSTTASEVARLKGEMDGIQQASIAEAMRHPVQTRLSRQSASSWSGSGRIVPVSARLRKSSKKSPRRKIVSPSKLRNPIARLPASIPSRRALPAASTIGEPARLHASGQTQPKARPRGTPRASLRRVLLKSCLGEPCLGVVGFP